MLNAGERKEITDNLFVLVQNSYGPLGGHPSIKNPSDVLNTRIYYWEAIDSDKDPDADAVLFGRKSPSGIKISGVGHDKSQNSKSILMNHLSKKLNENGYWIEASDRVADILYSNGAPYLDNKEDVEKVFNQEVEWLDDKGQYNREVAPGKYHVETVFGSPNI